MKMKKNYCKSQIVMFAILMFVGISSNVNSQIIYINEEWEENGCLIHENEKLSSVVDNVGNLIYTTNKAGTTGSNIFISRKNAIGNTIWERLISSIGEDYSTDLVIDNLGNTYVSGAKFNGINYDAYIAKLSPTGVPIWEKIFDQSLNDDVATSLVLDGSNNIVFTSTSRINNVNTNIITKKLNGQTGNLIWTKTYDYLNKLDVSGKVKIGLNNEIYVTGSYKANPNNAGVVLLKYNATNGNLLGSITHQGSNGLLSATVDVELSTDNKIYIVGISSNLDLSNKNILVVAFNTNLGFLWDKTIDFAQKDDEGVALKIGSDNKPIVTGYCTTNNSNSFIYTSKLNNTNGAEIWVDKRFSIKNNGNAKPTSISLDVNGNVTIVGEIDNENNVDFIAYNLKSDGEVRWQKMFDSNLGADDVPLKVNLFQDMVYITGKSITQNEKKVKTVKYKIQERTVNARIIDNKEAHVQNEIIVRFDKSAMKEEAVNKIGFNFGSLGDFVKPEIISDIQKIYPKIDWSNAKTFKIFKRMTMADSISTSRTGDKIKVQPFWATLLINVYSEDEVAVCNALNTNQVLFPKVQYAHVNGLFEMDSDDPLYSQQHSLMSTTYPEADINVEPAWQVEVGQPNVKVGIYDMGMKWNHEDFGGSATIDDCPNCKVKGGWDYGLNQSIFYTDNQGDTDDFPLAPENGHGTSVAGIIGALRNNTTGVSGIAGGNYPYTNVVPGSTTLNANESVGVSLYGFRAIGVGLALSELTEALVEGTVETGTFGYGLDIINNSWRRSLQYNDETPIESAQNLMRDCLREIFRNQTLNVCSRGNGVGENNYFPEYAKKEYWVLNVGGSDLNGRKHPSSGFGGDVDLIAPYDPLMMQTTYNLSTQQYNSFSGTSASAAHASGVAALMMSQVNDQPNTPNNLAPDDVEFLMQRYANDRSAILTDNVNEPYLDGYDKYTGWGLVDAGAAVEKVNRSEYVVKHVKYEGYVPNPFAGEVLTGNFTFGNDELPTRSYYGSILSFALNLDNNLQPSDVILDYWPLNSYSTLLVDEVNQWPMILDAEAGCKVNGMTHDYGDVRGWLIHILQDNNGNAMDYWYPCAPGDYFRVGYSLHIQSDYAGVDDLANEVVELSCFPNPSSKEVNINYILTQASDVKIEIKDINGKIVHSEELKKQYLGQHSVNIATELWSEGMYFVNLVINEKSNTIKYVKTK